MAHDQPPHPDREADAGQELPTNPERADRPVTADDTHRPAVSGRVPPPLGGVSEPDHGGVAFEKMAEEYKQWQRRVGAIDPYRLETTSGQPPPGEMHPYGTAPPGKAGAIASLALIVAAGVAIAIQQTKDRRRSGGSRSSVADPGEDHS